MSKWHNLQSCILGQSVAKLVKELDANNCIDVIADDMGLGEPSLTFLSACSH